MFDRKLSWALTFLAVLASYTDVLAQGGAAFSVNPSELYRHSGATHGMNMPCDAGPPVAGAGCGEATDRCTAPPRQVYVCHCPSCSQPRHGYPESARQPEAQSQPGAFVAPPQTGVQVGPSRQTSFGGMAIRFPEVRIGLPSIELPSRITKTRGAHMELDSAVADYRSYPAPPVQRVEYAAAPRYSSGATETARSEPESQPESAEVDDMRRRCEALAAQLRNKEAMLDQKLSELEQHLHSLRCLPPQPVAPRYQSGEACDPGRQPMTHTQGYRSLPEGREIGGMEGQSGRAVIAPTHPVDPKCVLPGSVGGMLSSEETGFGKPFGTTTETYYPSPDGPRSFERGQTQIQAERVPRPTPEDQGFRPSPEPSASTLVWIPTQGNSVKRVVPTAYEVSIPSPQRVNTAPRRLPRPDASR